MDYAKESLRLHGEWKGKIEVVATVPADSKDALSLAFHKERAKERELKGLIPLRNPQNFLLRHICRSW